MRKISLDDKWTLDRGRVLMNGTQAMARVLLAQRALDAAAGLNTAGYVSGYRGSPLGGFDSTLWSIGDRLAASNILFKPGVNEDIAATAVRGTQQLGSVPDPRYDGVFAAWYGKGPGVDRSLDALKHGNFAGVHRHGGVLLFYGDDHGGKSSTVAHHSEQAMAAALIPSLYPANVGEIVEYGLLAYAMSRFSGSWVGMKLVSEVAEQTATVDIDVADFSVVLPQAANLPPEGVHARTASFMPLREEQIASEHRLALVQQFVRANSIDRTAFRATTPRLALITAGKSYGDTRQALDLLGLTDARASALGISLYKIGCIWPLEPQMLIAFAEGHETLFVIEEKESFLEIQAAQALFNVKDRPLLIGKRDEEGNALLSTTAQLEPLVIALAIAGRLSRMAIRDPDVEAACDRLRRHLQPPASALEAAVVRRAPYFCSGCPHSRSTRIPEGSLSMTGIGCHTMVALARPAEALLPTQMGGEGANWMGLAPFTGTRHMFQNMGDGTYYHSGLLAVRAAVASGANITYKILYNDAVAMTGGQPVDGPISVAEIAQQVRHEGVKTILLLSDNPDIHRGNPGLPPDVAIHHRDELDIVQRALRESPGCTVLIYEQTCAAEKRRRRKRGLYPDPPKRMFIAKSVCEGCGDCSVQSTCVSILPAETDFGVKRQIDQSSCNKDYSCLNGFCPSFITVEDGEPRKPAMANFEAALFEGLPEPPLAPLESGFNLLIAGVGGTGVVTVGAILGMAAHLEGHAASLFDMTGLAQKNGAVFSHVRIAGAPENLHAQRLGRGEADIVLAFDLVAAISDEASMLMSPGRTRALVNSDVVPTIAFQFDRDATIDGRLLLARLHRRIGEAATATVDAVTLSSALLGNSIGSNLFLAGVASQRGMLPVSPSAIEQAVRLNATAIEFNLSAFRLGRLYAADAARIEGLLPQGPDPIPRGLDALIERRGDHLARYQNAAYAQRYQSLVEQVRAAEQRVAPGRETLTATVARAYARVLAYKDEYEVARLLTDPALEAELRTSFSDGARLSFNLAAPILAGKAVNGRPGKRAFAVKTLKPVLRLIARAKGLRGTMFDPFGRSVERRNERALVDEYEMLVQSTLAMLSPDNIEGADSLLALVDLVRGYGPVKEAALALYKQKLPGAQEAFIAAGASVLKA